MTYDAHKNFAYSTVATPPAPALTGTSLVVAAGEGARFPAVSFNAVVWPAGANPLPTNAEVVRVSAGPPGSDTFTVARAQEGSSARAIVAGDQIADAITAKALTDIEARLAFPASTIAGLGTGADGELGLLRAGASPYEFVALRYDATFGKWVSPAVPVVMNLVSVYTSAAAVYTVVSDASVRRGHIFNYKDLYDAGLRLQVFVEGTINNSGAGGTSFLSLGLWGIDPGDTTPVLLGAAGGGEISVTGVTSLYRFSGWVDFNPAAPTKAHAVLIAMVKNSAGTGTFSGPNASYRLVG